MGLAIEVKIGEQIQIGDDIIVTVYSQKTNKVRLHFDAPKEIRIERKPQKKDSYDKG